MNRLLGCLLLIGITGCGETAPSSSDRVPTSKRQQSQDSLANAPPAAPQNTSDTPTASVGNSDAAIAAVEKLAARIDRNEEGDVVAVHLANTDINDAALVHLKDLGGLQSVSLPKQITAAGLAHLADMAELQALYLPNSQIGDAGLVHLTGLARLQTLILKDSGISDAGLSRSFSPLILSFQNGVRNADVLRRIAAHMRRNYLNFAAVFRVMDRDRDGRVSRAELRALIEAKKAKQA